LTARRWPVYVVASLWVSEEEFDVVGPPVQVIEVPRAADSALHTFTLIPLRSGQSAVHVRFEQNNTYLGAAKVLTEVVETPPLAAGSAPVLHTPRLVADLQPPDVTLYVKEVDPLTYAMSARLASDDPSGAARELGRFAFPRPPEEYVDALFADLDAKSKRKLPATEFDDMLAKIGSSLFDSLSRGNDLRAFYWEQMHGQVHTVQIVSQEPYIPWEIVRPSRPLPDRTWESAPFLGQGFALSRWLVDGFGPADRAALRHMTLVLPPSNLKFVQAEAESLQQTTGLTAEKIADKETLEQFLRNGASDVLHFACHGEFETEAPDRSAVWLGQSYWQPRELTAEYRSFGRTQPLVFLNACDTGRVGFGLTGLAGWAQAFLESGAGVFIGAMWKIDDKLAADFAQIFYELIIQGVPVGEAVRQARERVRQPGDATWLSYTLYANPTVRATVASLVS
jgi:hypothetical protein